MVKSRKCVGLATTELRNQRHHGRGVLCVPGKAPESHPGVLSQRPCKTGSRKELLWNSVILGRGTGDHLLQGNCEFIRVERPALPYLLARRNSFVPGLHRFSPVDLLRKRPRHTTLFVTLFWMYYLFLRHAAPGPRPRHSTLPPLRRLRRILRIMSRLTPGQASSSCVRENGSGELSMAASII